jgi:3',5'-cyclic AMP phosphodiesterase CpdA
VLIAQLSDVHVGRTRYREELLRTAIEEVNADEPDLVVVAGDLTDDGYPDQYPLAARELGALACPRIVRVPGNHDARNVGYLRYEDAFGARDSRLQLNCGGVEVALVAVDSSKPDLDEGEIGREHYGWIEEGFAGEAELRIFVCHHHLVPVPGTGRERNQVLDAGDVLSLLRQCGVDLVLSGHRHGRSATSPACSPPSAANKTDRRSNSSARSPSSSAASFARSDADRPQPIARLRVQQLLTSITDETQMHPRCYPTPPLLYGAHERETQEAS